MVSLLVLMVVSVLVAVGCTTAVGAVIALWMARRTGGGAFYLWRFSLVYDRQGDEPFPGKGYTMNLDDGVEDAQVFKSLEDRSMNMLDEIYTRFTYHPPHGDQPQRYEKIRAKAKEFAYLLTVCCPFSPDLTKALNHLDLAVFLANASIARNESDGNCLAMATQEPSDMVMDQPCPDASEPTPPTTGTLGEYESTSFAHAPGNDISFSPGVEAGTCAPPP